MQKHLGDILLEKGYITPQALEKALAYQMRKVLGGEFRGDWVTSFLLEVARTKYNNRDEFYLGKILTELKLLPERKVLEALEIQKESPAEKPRGRLDALNQIIIRINSSYNLIDLLNQVLVLAARLVEAESASLIVHDRAKDSLVILIPTGPNAEAVRELEIPKDKGIAGWVYAHSRSAISNDAAVDARFYPAIDAATGYRSRQILCVPLTVKEKRLGAVEVINKIGAPGFTHADRFLLEMLSGQAAIAIENTRLAVALTQLEEDLEVRKLDVAEAERVRIAALVSDSFLQEMRRSLVPLRGWATRLREVSGDERVEKYRAYIDTEMARLIAHAEDVVRFLRDEYAVAAKPLDLRDLLRELESRAWVDCRVGGISFEVSMDAEVELKADRELLLKALEGIFRNSREAMPEGGTFSIAATVPGDGTVRLAVRDTGRGIDAEPVELVFEPFYSRGKRHAAGLGLSIAKRIVEAHGGTIVAEKGDGSRGALFTLTLPVPP